MDLGGWIAYKFSGEKAMDYFQASQTMAFDIWKKLWSEDFLKGARIDPGIFPELRQAGSSLGTVAEEVSEKMNLSGDTMVAVGGHDYRCAALGAGSVNRDIPLNSVGTNDVFLVSGERNFIFELDNEHLSSGCHVVPGKYYSHTCLDEVGGNIDWFFKNL